MVSIDFLSYLLLLVWCLLAAAGVLVAAPSLLIAYKMRAAGVAAGAVVVLLGVASLAGVIWSAPGFWWIAVLPIYLGYATIRAWLNRTRGRSQPQTQFRAQFRLSTLLVLLAVAAFIAGGISMQWREHARMRAIATRIEARGGEVHTGLDSITGIVFYNATDADLAELQQDLESIRGLRSLQIGGAEFTDAGLKHVSQLTGLQELNLQNTQVSDAGLASISQLPALRTLDLMGTKVSDRGLPELEPLTNLRRVWLSGSAVTGKGRDRLQKALPAAEVSN